jgi:hypothetical protein
MQDTVLAKTYRSTIDNTIIKISTTITASYVALMGHNLTETATITLQGNDTDAWGAPALEETVPWRENIAILDFNESTYNFWRILITDDDTNADGYIELGGVFLGTYLQMPGMKKDQTLSYQSESKSSVSPSGQNYGDERYEYRNPSFNFPLITHDQRDNLNEMFIANKNIKPMIVLIWANDLNLETPMYAKIDQKGLIFKRNTKSELLPWGAKLKFREVF